MPEVAQENIHCSGDPRGYLLTSQTSHTNPVSPAKRPPVILISIIVGMIVWTSLVSIVAYGDYQRSVEAHANLTTSVDIGRSFFRDGLPGYALLWLIGMTSMTVMRFRLRRYMNSLESANAHLVADGLRSERAEAIASFGHWELDLRTKAFRGSAGAAAIYGLQEREWAIEIVQAIPLREYRAPLDEALARLLAGTGTYDIEFKIRRLTDGSIRDIHSVAMYDRSAYLVTGVIHDVTEFHAAQRLVQESERRYRLLADNAIDVIWTTDLEGTFTYMSPSIMQLRGFTPEEVVNTKIEDVIMPASRNVVRAALRAGVQDALDGRNSIPRYIEVEQPRKDGTTVWTEVNARILFDENGTPIGLIGVSRDVSLQRAYREQLEMSLRDKDVLLREVHHRVKNNLQVISSLLNLQAESYSDPQARILIKESQQRIRSMALVHEKLYRSPHMSSIDFSDYLGTMTQELMRSFGNPRIRTRVSGEEIRLDVEKAIPAGLILNELLTNALKHAFPPHVRDAELSVRVQMDGTDVVLTVQDNGIGLPPDRRIEDMRTMGMTVVHGLTQQLDGSIAVLPGPGAGFRLRFPLENES
jgi:PAS domain S-box-containing protein